MVYLQLRIKKRRNPRVVLRLFFLGLNMTDTVQKKASSAVRPSPPYSFPSAETSSGDCIGKVCLCTVHMRVCAGFQVRVWREAEF
jgi:hypothetical protein